MENIRLFLAKIYRKLQNIFFLYKISSQVGLDNVVSIINLIENEYGHKKSVLLGKPVDAVLKAIPWYTYPAIEYLKQFDFSDKNIFEYGSGNSSIFWASLAKSVTSVEKNALWFEVISKSESSNLTISLKEQKSEYVNFIGNGNMLYDLIVIDGDYRYECAKVAVKYLIILNGILNYVQI